jgi:4-amino-4-deoxy-L-arabinose transferase-like glycosyltransferase
MTIRDLTGVNHQTWLSKGGAAEMDPGGGRPLLIWSEDRVYLAVLFLLALALRLGLAISGGINHIDEGDARSFYSEAVGIAEGRGLLRTLPKGGSHLSAYHMPLTALLISGEMEVFGTSATASRLFAITIGSLSAPLVYLLAATIMPRRWALLAGLAWSVHPVFLFYSILTMAEPFYIPLLLLAILLSIKAMEQPTFAMSLLAGTSWGIATLCRPHAAPAGILMALGMGLTLKSWRLPLGLILGAAIVLTPWWARNFVVFGRPVLLSLEGGETFLGSNNPYVVADPELAGMWIAPSGIPEYRVRMKECHDEVELNQTMMKLGMDYLRSHPEVVPRLIINKWARWLTPITKSGGWNRIVVLSTYGSLLVLVVLGVVLGTIRRSPLLLATLAITLADLAVVAVYWGNLTRGRIDLELIWLPWSVQTFRLLVGLPFAVWSSRRMGGYRDIGIKVDERS